jgi:hypothetical protein
MEADYADAVVGSFRGVECGVSRADNDALVDTWRLVSSQLIIDHQPPKTVLDLIQKAFWS